MAPMEDERTHTNSERSSQEGPHAAPTVTELPSNVQSRDWDEQREVLALTYIAVFPELTVQI